MAGRALVCLLVACLAVNVIDCGRSSGGSRGGGSRGGGSRSGGSSHSSGGYGHSSGGHSSYGGSSYSKPSYSSSGSHSYPSTGLSSFGLGYGKSSYPASTGLSGSSSGYGKSSYPASTGLSGFSSGYGKSSYPASTGLSGSSSGYGKPSYPASTGLSGSSSGYGKPSYPASTGWAGSGSGYGKSSYPASTGLSGSSSGYGKPSYPASTGWSGSGSGYGKPSSSHSYPSSSNGLSGSGSGYGNSGYGKVSNNNYNSHSSYNPKQYSNTHTGYNPGHPYYTPPSYHTYYSSPQYVYVQQYRNSGSRYGDLLTGLAIYNLGRSHSHYHSHYYHDDYYRQRYNSYGTASNNPQEYAACILRIKENGREELLKIPCEIVSTFTKSGEKVAESVSNTTVCVTNTTTVNNTAPAVTVSTPSPVTLPTINSDHSTNSNLESTLPPINLKFTNGTIDFSKVDAAVASAFDSVLPKISEPDPYIPKLAEISTTTAPITMPVTSNISVVNSTHCVTTVAKDPLQVKGGRVDPSRMQCSVEIHTNGSVLRNHVDCNVLIEQARKPEPKKDSILPPRHKLKHWMEKLPWWFSLFVAV